MGGSTVGLMLVVIAVVLAIGGGDDMSPTPTVQAESAPLPAATPVTLPAGPVAPVISRIPTSNRVMFFTIDDGLVQDPAVVDYLRRARVPVTMFILPRYVSQNPPYFRSIQALGASIQDHTVNHRPLNVMSFGRQVAEICGALDPLTTTFGQRPWLFRPPYGSYNADTKRAVRACGLQAIVTWQGTMNDGVLRLQHPGSLQPGDIVLLHFRPDLRQNLAVLLAAAHAAGLRPAPLEPYLPLP